MQAASGGDRSLDGTAPPVHQLGNGAIARLLAGAETSGDVAATHQLATVHQLGNRAVARMLADAGVGRAAATSAVGGALDADLAARIDAGRGGGQRLPDGIRIPMQNQLGTDLHGVRVHTDATAATLARSVDAQAFTTGQDVFFDAGNYEPQSPSGRELIAHEVVHVAQQSSGGLSFSGRVSDPADPAEVEARSLAPALARSVDATATDASPAGLVPASAQVHRAPNPGTAAPDLGSVLSVAALEELRRLATEVTILAGAYAERGIGTVDTLKASLVASSDTYTQAYDNYAGVVRGRSSPKDSPWAGRSWPRRRGRASRPRPRRASRRPASPTSPGPICSPAVLTRTC